MTFDHTLAQQAEVTAWENIPPCIIKPESCNSGASVLAWVKMTPNCPNWGGIFGSQGNMEEGLVVACRNGASRVM